VLMSRLICRWLYFAFDILKFFLGVFSELRVAEQVALGAKYPVVLLLLTAFSVDLYYRVRQSPNTGIWTTGRCNAVSISRGLMPNYFVEFNPFFGSPDHVPHYIATSNYFRKSK
jgi:hypothetical protein